MDRIRTMPSNKRAYAWGLTAIVFGAIVTLSLMRPNIPTLRRAELWVGEARVGEFVRSVHATGRLEAVHQRWISAEVSGEIVALPIQPGTEVTPNSISVRLRNRNVEARMQSARTALTASQAGYAAQALTLESKTLDIESRIAELGSDLKLAQLENEAETVLAKKNVISNLKRAQTKARVEQLTARLAMEKRRLASFKKTVAAQLLAEALKTDEIKAQLRNRKHQLEALDIRAGMHAVLQSISKEVGQHVEADTPVALVSQPMPLRVRLRVPQGQVQPIRLGMKASVIIRGHPVAASVTRIAPRVEKGVVEVWMQLPDVLPDAARIALSVQANITLESDEDVLSIPRPSGLIESHPNIELFLLDATGLSASRVPVRLGRFTNDRVEVLAGLKPHQRVVLSDTSGWPKTDRIHLD